MNMIADHRVDVQAENWDAIWTELSESGEVALDEFDRLDESTRSTVALALDELASLGFVSSTGPRTWARSF
jgi:hypothetical protein